MKTTFALPIYALAIVLSQACRGQGIKPVERQPFAVHLAALKNSGHERIAQGLQAVSVQAPFGGGTVTVEMPLMLTTNKQNGEWTISTVQEKLGSTLLIGTNLRRIPEGSPLPTFDRAKAQTALVKLKEYGASFYPDKAQELVQQSGMRRAYSGEAAFMMKATLELAYTYHRHVVDSNKVRMNIDGEDIEITQGELVQVMSKRVNKLKVERAELEKRQGDPAQIARINGLIERYGETAGAPVKTPDFKDEMEPTFAEVFVKPDGTFRVLVINRDGVCITVAGGDSFSDNPQ